jgi:hypothetical protein
VENSDSLKYLNGSTITSSKCRRSSGFRDSDGRADWTKSVTDILGTLCNPCLRAGPQENGAPGRIRTVDLVLRRHTLYPSELRAQSETSLSSTIVLRSVVRSQWIGVGRRPKFKGTTDERESEANVRKRVGDVMGLEQRAGHAVLLLSAGKSSRRGVCDGGASCGRRRVRGLWSLRRIWRLRRASGFCLGNTADYRCQRSPGSYCV